ncbi:Roquin-2 [Frankliniella fusca]|uniref:Roquin-2 n=1 Tax=Frankliniella fusca TaxID=407009 RepID=A0AAE1HF97_9NEOP|nr:Roquin-2 [Frankliniella fusca]
MAPKCDICFHKFDLELHRPKCLPCGHTLCKECLQNPALDKKCPTCRKELSADPADHPDNIFVIQMVEVDDEDDAGPPLKKIKTEEETKLQPLVRGVEAGRKVVEKLQQVVPVAVEALNRLLESSAAQLRQLEEGLGELEQTGADVTEEHLQMAAQTEDAARLLAVSKFSVVAEEEDEVSGESWRASLQLQPVEHVLFPVLLQLRANGQLAKVDDYTDPSPSSAYVGPPGTDVLKIRHKHDLDYDGHLMVNAILQDEQRWKHARCLRHVHGVGAEKLLRIIGPQLEELESLGQVSASFMQAVEKMKSLKRLVVSCDPDEGGYPDLPLQLEELAVDFVKEEQLRCIPRMPHLRSLAVTNYTGTDMWFPPARHGRLAWLKVGMKRDQETTMLSLVNAYGSSLQELQIVCAVSEAEKESDDDDDDNDVAVNSGREPYFPDLDVDLAACDLPRLRRLVLVRSSAPGPCPEVDACLLQRRAFRKFFGTAVDVVCDACPISRV